MPRVETSMPIDKVVEFLRSGRTGVLATNGRDGFPHQVAMWYVPIGTTLRMWSYRKSQKTMNLRRDTRASFLIETGNEYHTLRGVALSGEVELVDDFESVLEVGMTLRQRYFDVGPPLTREALSPQAAKRVGLVLRPGRIVSWDHRRL